MPHRSRPEARVRRRTQLERSTCTRAALIEAGVRCLCRSGCSATTMIDVAQEAGLSKGAVQHHFTDKRDFMLCVAYHGWKELSERLGDLSAIEGQLDERVDAVIDLMLESYSSPSCRAAYEVRIAGRHDRALQRSQDPLYKEAYRTVEAEWERVFADAPVSKERVRDARRLARSLLPGILVLHEVEPEIENTSGAIELLKETIHWVLTTPSG
jgi:AcrR family transcriptional regulator